VAPSANERPALLRARRRSTSPNSDKLLHLTLWIGTQIGAFLLDEAAVHLPLGTHFGVARAGRGQRAGDDDGQAGERPDRLSFDLRDFDETLRGPFEWDLKRYVASLVVLARDTGVSERAAVDAVRAALRAYRERMTRYAAASELDIWYDLVTSDQVLQNLFESEERDEASARLHKQARRRTHTGSAPKLTRVEDGQLRIIDKPPNRTRLEDLVDGPACVHIVTEALQSYRSTLPYERRYLLDRFTFADAVRQVVGVGSVGMQIYLVLLEGRHGDPLFLQLKQAGPAVYEQHLGSSPYPNHGQRVIKGKRLIQAASDVFLGWTTGGGADFYVRQFRDMKVVPDPAVIAPVLVQFADMCGVVLARAHARTGDAVAIDGYIGKGRRFDRAAQVRQQLRRPDECGPRAAT